MNFDDTDLLVMAKTLYGEIRGYDHASQVAVAWAIRNRAERNNMPFFAGERLGKAGAVSRVCLYPWQFSCWNHNDPNRPLLDALKPDQLDHQLSLAKLVLGDQESDPTLGGDHYYTEAKPVWAAEWPPAWAHQYKRTAQVGPHIFHDSRSPA
jgi:N-acetylmuramoyl-L-alanine amidase